MQHLRTTAAAVLLAVGLAAPAAACPVCASETGRAVRAGIFGADFAANLLTAALPFPIVLGMAAALHHGFGRSEGRDP